MIRREEVDDSGEKVPLPDYIKILSMSTESEIGTINLIGHSYGDSF